MKKNGKHKLFEGEAFQEYSKEELNAFDEIANRASKLNVPKGKSKEVVWNDVLNKIDKQEDKPASRPVYWVAAASVILLAVGYFFLYPSDTVVSIGNGEIATINLPNGSIVTLNAASGISYNEDNWKEERVVNLSGQAKFEVTEGVPFRVKTDHGVVTVLGTVFDVFDRETKYIVGCESGKVEVQVEKQVEILQGGQGTVMTNGRLFAGDMNVNSSWIRGEFHYESEQLGLVLDEIERQFDVEISRTNIEDLRLYSGFFTNKNLEAALELVLPPMNLRYKVIGKEIQITLND